MEVIAVWLVASQNLNSASHLDVYEPVFFKLGMVTGTIELYILVLVWMTLTLIQGRRDARNQKNFCSVFW